MGTQNTLAASVQPKKGRLYAVIQVKENGKSKAVWRSLGLPEGTGKSKVNKAFREVVKSLKMNMPSGLHEMADRLQTFSCSNICVHILKRLNQAFKKAPFKATT